MDNFYCGKCNEKLRKNGVFSNGKIEVLMSDLTRMWEIECPICLTINVFPVELYRHNIKTLENDGKKHD